MDCHLTLPPALTIFTVAECHPVLLGWLATGLQEDRQAPLQVDASTLVEIDSAGLQLLVALANALGHRGRRLVLERPAAALQAQCAALGLRSLLAEQETQGAAP